VAASRLIVDGRRSTLSRWSVFSKSSRSTNQVYQRPREWRDDGEQIETFGSLITSFDPQQR